MLTREIRVLIVDDHEVVRSGVSALVTRQADMTVVGEARSAEEAFALLKDVTPDVVMLDHRLPGMSGAAACREILRLCPSAAVIALTTYADDAIIHSFLAAGARGFLLKGATAEELMKAIRNAARGESVIAPEALTRIVDWARRAKSLHSGDETLAPHELVALSLTAQGMTNREIARRLGVSEGTVKAYLRATMRKLGVTERSHAVAAGIKLGVI